MPSFSKLFRLQYLAYPIGIVKGALQRLGVPSSVVVETNQLPQCEYRWRMGSVVETSLWLCLSRICGGGRFAKKWIFSTLLTDTYLVSLFFQLRYFSRQDYCWAKGLRSNSLNLDSRPIFCRSSLATFLEQKHTLSLFLFVKIILSCS